MCLVAGITTIVGVIHVHAHVMTHLQIHGNRSIPCPRTACATQPLHPKMVSFSHMYCTGTESCVHVVSVCAVGNIFLIGGRSSDYKKFNTMRCYDTKSDKWSEMKLPYAGGWESPSAVCSPVDGSHVILFPSYVRSTFFVYIS